MTLIYAWFGLQTVLSGNLGMLVQQHEGLLEGVKSKKTWRLLWFAVTWSLWLLRNDVLFKQAILDLDRVFELIKIRVWSWCNARVKKERFSFLDWSINPQTCILYNP